MARPLKEDTIFFTVSGDPCHMRKFRENCLSQTEKGGKLQLNPKTEAEKRDPSQNPPLAIHTVLEGTTPDARALLMFGFNVTGMDEGALMQKRSGLLTRIAASAQNMLKVQAVINPTEMPDEDGLKPVFAKKLVPIAALG